VNAASIAGVTVIAMTGCDVWTSAAWRRRHGAPVAEIERKLGLYRDVYRGFTVNHFHEQLGRRHDYTLAIR
jgi:hypothetical protein